MTSELQRDIERMDLLMRSMYPDGDDAGAAWQRIRQRLTPDRERVAIAICEALTTPKGVMWWAMTEEHREAFRAKADAAINAMGEP